MKKIFKISLLCIAMLIITSVCALAAEFTVTSTVPTEIEISDAKTTPISVSGTYDAETKISLQIKNTATGKTVLYQQTNTDEDGNFTISGTMSNAVEVGTYELKLGATNMSSAKIYYFNIIEDTAKVVVSVSDGTANVKVNGTDKGTANSTAYYIFY